MGSNTNVKLIDILKQLDPNGQVTGASGTMVKQPMMQELQDVRTAEGLAGALANYKQQQEQASTLPSPDQVQRSQAMLKAEPLGAPMKTNNPTVANKRSGNFAMSLEEFMKKQKGEA